MQTVVHWPQESHASDVETTPFRWWMACWGQAPAQSRQCRQRSSKYRRSGRKLRLSGLRHHQQESGQPLKKTVVRMPGPSCVAKRMTLKMQAESALRGDIPDRSELVPTIFIQLGLINCISIALGGNYKAASGGRIFHRYLGRISRLLPELHTSVRSPSAWRIRTAYKPGAHPCVGAVASKPAPRSAGFENAAATSGRSPRFAGNE